MTQQDEKKAVVVTDPGLLNRTSWTNASVALTHIKKVRSYGGPWSRLDQTQPWRVLYSMSGWRLLTLCSIEPSHSGHLACPQTHSTPLFSSAFATIFMIGSKIWGIEFRSTLHSSPLGSGPRAARVDEIELLVRVVVTGNRSAARIE